MEGVPNDVNYDTFHYPLNELYLQNTNWGRYFECQYNDGEKQSILGLKLLKSNIFWRYLENQYNKTSNLKKTRKERANRLKEF